MSVPGGRPVSIEARLARLGLRATPATAALIHALGLTAGVLRPPEPDTLVDPRAQAVITEIAAAADPDLALSTLARVVAADGPDSRLPEQVRADPALRHRLITVLGLSSGLGDHLVRHPDQAAAMRPAAAGPVELRARLLAAVGADPSEPLPWGSGGATAEGSDASVLAALRVAYHREMLGIAARDLGGELSVQDVARELADLAAAGLEASLAVAAAGLEAGFQPVRLAVVAMGKCGGRELNYASDVDAVLVAEPLPGGAEDGALLSATRLAEGLVRVAGAVTPEGTLFPVDLGLRPEGGNGPLVRSLSSHTAYYQRHASTWEFQALLKARPVAGDLGLGQRWSAVVAPLVWSAANRPDLVGEVQSMRRRVEKSLSRKAAARDLKLGPGGLRDIEFPVQLLQLVHGRDDDTLRSPATLPALQALAAGGYVAQDDADILAASYRWLRTVEHRVQLRALQRTHAFPEREADQRWLARSLGLRDPAALRDEHLRVTREVRRVHERVFYRPLLDAVAQLPPGAARLTPQAALARLTALGFDDPAAAVRHLSALTTGISRAATVQRGLLQVMLGWVAQAADPDAGLLAVRQVSDALADRPAFLRLLRDEGAAAHRLVDLLVQSRYLTGLLSRSPQAVGLLSDDAALRPRPAGSLSTALLTAVARHAGDAEAVVRVARALRRDELVRVAAADLLGHADVPEVGRALSEAARATLEAALRVALDEAGQRAGGPLPCAVAVIGLGRLGGGELAYGSDADVLFVHRARSGASEAEAQRCAVTVAERVRALLALPSPDPPLLIDAGLRPEGRQGPLSRSLSAYAAYYPRWGSAWETQALLRADLAAGDPDLGRDFLTLVDGLRYAGVSDPDVVEVRRLKARMEAERLPRGLAGHRERHLKLGPGGLSDVEWAVQLLQLRHAADVPTLRVTGTLAALSAARGAGLLTDHDAELLAGGWLAASRARNAVTLVTGRFADVLPPRGRDLDAVARLLGYPPREQQAYLEDLRSRSAQVREVTQRLFLTDQIGTDQIGTDQIG